MNQATFFNLRVMASTKAIRAARRATERGTTATTITSSAAGAADLDSSRMPSPEPCPERVDRFCGQIEFNMTAEDRQFRFYGMKQCPVCGGFPVLDQREGRRFRVVCASQFYGRTPCGYPCTEWTNSPADAKLAWDLAVKLSK